MAISKVQKWEDYRLESEGDKTEDVAKRTAILAAKCVQEILASKGYIPEGIHLEIELRKRGASNELLIWATTTREARFERVNSSDGSEG